MVPAIFLGILIAVTAVLILRSRPSGRLDSWGDYDAWQRQYGHASRSLELERHLRAEYDRDHRMPY